MDSTHEPAFREARESRHSDVTRTAAKQKQFATTVRSRRYGVLRRFRIPWAITSVLLVSMVGSALPADAMALSDAGAPDAASIVADQSGTADSRNLPRAAAIAAVSPDTHSGNAESPIGVALRADASGRSATRFQVPTQQVPWDAVFCATLDAYWLTFFTDRCDRYIDETRWEQFQQLLENEYFRELVFDIHDERWDQIQQLLEHAGAVPRYGLIFDTANVLIALGRGNLDDAGLYLVFAMPISGTVAYMTVKIKNGRAILQAAESPADAGRKLAPQLKFAKLRNDALIERLYGRRYKGKANEAFLIRLPHNVLHFVEPHDGTDRLVRFVFDETGRRPIEASAYLLRGGKRHATFTPYKHEIFKAAGFTGNIDDYEIDHLLSQALLHGPNEFFNYLLLHKNAHAVKNAIETALDERLGKMGSKIKSILITLRPEFDDDTMIAARLGIQVTVEGVDGSRTIARLPAVPNNSTASRLNGAEMLEAAFRSAEETPSATGKLTLKAGILTALRASGLAAADTNSGQDTPGQDSDSANSNSASVQLPTTERTVGLLVGKLLEGDLKEKHCKLSRECYWFDITLSGDFGPGPHRYRCYNVNGWTRDDGTHTWEPWADHWSNGSPSSQCFSGYFGTQVYVTVDGVKSNTLTWSPPPDF